MECNVMHSSVCKCVLTSGKVSVGCLSAGCTTKVPIPRRTRESVEVSSKDFR